MFEHSPYIGDMKVSPEGRCLELLQSLKAGKSRWVSSTRKLVIHMDSSNREEQFM